MDPGKKWTIAALQNAINRGINLPTLLGPANGQYTIRAEDGVGTCILESPQESQADFVTFAFETGEIWAITTWPFKGHPKELFIGEIESMFCELLPRYSRFLDTLGIPPPYKWMAALAGTKGRELQYPVPPGRMRIPGLAGPKCASDNVPRTGPYEGSYDGKQSPINALVPFFDEVYNACGMERPEHLPR